MIKKNLLILLAAGIISAASGGESSGAGRRYAGAGELSPTGEIADGIRRIELEAFQFGFDPEVIVVIENETVEITAVSTDVAHGFGLDEYGINRVLEPGKEEVISFTAGEPGRHTFHCTVFCGAGHGRMQGELIIISED